jgi:hypothetical protein
MTKLSLQEFEGKDLATEAVDRPPERRVFTHGSAVYLLEIDELEGPSGQDSPGWAQVVFREVSPTAGREVAVDRVPLVSREDEPDAAEVINREEMAKRVRFMLAKVHGGFHPDAPISEEAMLLMEESAKAALWPDERRLASLKRVLDGYRESMDSPDSERAYRVRLSEMYLDAVPETRDQLAPDLRAKLKKWARLKQGRGRVHPYPAGATDSESGESRRR